MYSDSTETIFSSKIVARWQTPISESWWLADGFIVTRLNEHSSEIEIADWRRYVDSIAEQIGQEKMPVMLILHRNSSTNAEVRKYYASKEGSRNILAEAMVVTALAPKILANFFLREFSN